MCSAWTGWQLAVRCSRSRSRGRWTDSPASGRRARGSGGCLFLLTGRGWCFLSFGRRLQLVRIIGHIPAAPFEHDARRGDEAANGFAASLAGGQRVVLHALFHFELIRTTVALILINRHRWSSYGVTVTDPSPSLLQLLQRPPQPLQSVRDRVHARGIGEANVTLAAKRFARHDRDLRVLEKIGREVRR